MVNKVINILFIILYTVYTLIAVNTRLVEQIIPYGNYYVYFYIAAILAILLFFHKKTMPVRIGSLSFQTLSVFTVYILVFGLITFLEGPEGDLGAEMLTFLKYICVAAVTVYFVNYFELFHGLLIGSLVGGSALLLYQFQQAGFPMDVFGRLDSFFSTSYAARYRRAFGFNNFNTVGNIASCMLLVYFLLLAWERINGKPSLLKRLRILFYTAIAVQNIIILLSSGSRNSFVTLIAFGLFLLYFHITEFEGLHSFQRTFLRAVIIFAGIAVVYFSVYDAAIKIVTTSGRWESLEVNIPLVFRSHRLLEGLGLMNPGLFGRGRRGYIVDNYYLYVFIETGIIGLCIIMYLLIRITARVRTLRVNRRSFYIFLSSAYGAWLVSGLGETCVLYPYFASSLIFLIIFLTAADMKSADVKPSGAETAGEDSFGK